MTEQETPAMTIRTRALLMLAAAALVLVAACSSDTQSQIEEAAGQVSLPASDDSGGGGDDSSASDDGSTEQPSDDGSSGDDSSGDDSSGDDSSGGDGSSGDGSSADSSASTGDDGEISDQEWAWIVVLGIAAFAIIIFAVAMSSRHSDNKQTARSDLDRQLGDIVGTSRWVHDSGSLDVVTTNDPDQLRSSSADVQQRLRDLESQVAKVRANTSDQALSDSLGTLSQASAGLRSATDGLVTARLAGDSDNQEALINSA
ncbi:MAG: hypothetical protein OES57_14365, partial [Acidimicrobiia bacterium]|nr:hypothetical protein [Acidimicrobiia bacterium]